MKSTLLFLFAALQTGFLFAQFDENYLGYYKSDDESDFCYVGLYNEEEFGYLNPTESEKKTAVFAFAISLRNGEYDGGGFVTKKGNSYATIPNEYAEQFTFSFKLGADNVTRIVEITEKSGKKTILTQYPESVEYYDEGVYMDGDTTDVYGYYDEESPAALDADIRGYSRSDGADLVINFSTEPVEFTIHIPATKTCSEVMIEGVFDSTEPVNGAYLYTNQELSYTLEVKATDTGWQLKCLKGECFDKKNKCAIWKEAFMQNN